MFYEGNEKYYLLVIFQLIPRIIRGLVCHIKFKSKYIITLIGKRVKILGKRKDLEIGKHVKIEDDVCLQTVSKNGVHLGNYVTIGSGTQIRPSAYYGGKIGWGLYVGDGSYIGPNSYIGCSGKIIIGKNVLIGPHCTMIAENHIFSDVEKFIEHQGCSNIGIEIKDNVWLGSNVTVLDGVIIESGCVIGAGAVVTRSTVPNGVYLGVPARLSKLR